MPWKGPNRSEVKINMIKFNLSIKNNEYYIKLTSSLFPKEIHKTEWYRKVKNKMGGKYIIEMK